MTNITDTNRWEEIQEKLKKKYLELIDSDFICIDGKREDMLVKLAAKIGKTRQQLNQIIAFI
ncbi:MAG TPA: hypothetical protein PLA68_08550 [Panacibacter sp.]|nr:hypothetical protein [Panacibacter sp.]